MAPIFVSGCGLGSALLKIFHTAYCKPKLLKVTKVVQNGEEETSDFYRNRVNSEPKSSLLIKKEKCRIRNRTESTGPALDDLNNSDEEKDKRISVNEFFKKPPHKTKKKK